jgi:hypothetical protein
MSYGTTAGTDALSFREPRVPFVDEAAPQAQTGVRQHLGQDGVVPAAWP